MSKPKMKRLYLVVCDTDIDRYIYLSEQDIFENYINTYAVCGETELELFIDIQNTLENYDLDFHYTDIDNLDLINY